MTIITYEEDGAMVVDQKAMIVGRFYETLFGGVPGIVVKDSSGMVHFYYEPADSSPEDEDPGAHVLTLVLGINDPVPSSELWPKNAAEIRDRSSMYANWQHPLSKWAIFKSWLRTKLRWLRRGPPAVLLVLLMGACAKMPAPQPQFEALPTVQAMDPTRASCQIRILNVSSHVVSVNLTCGDEQYDLGEFVPDAGVALFAYCDLEDVLVLASPVDSVRKFADGSRLVGISKRLVEGSPAVILVR